MAGLMVSPAVASSLLGATVFAGAFALAFFFAVETVVMETSALMTSVSFFSPNNVPLLTPNH